jgi:hypothetical protein
LSSAICRFTFYLEGLVRIQRKSSSSCTKFIGISQTLPILRYLMGVGAIPAVGRFVVEDSRRLRISTPMGRKDDLVRAPTGYDGGQGPGPRGAFCRVRIHVLETLRFRDQDTAVNTRTNLAVQSCNLYNYYSDDQLLQTCFEYAKWQNIISRIKWIS